MQLGRRIGILVALAAGTAAHADTIPCTDGFVERKVRQFFNYVQESRKTGFKAGKLDGAHQTAEEKLSEEGALRRYCEATLHVDNGDAIPVFIAITSRDIYKKPGAEDLQSCWEVKKYGEPSVIGASSGCKPLKAPAKR